MAKEERITWTPANGLNMEDPAIRVRQDQCVESRNMLFERGVARTRPYAVRDTYTFWPSPSTNKYRFARGMLVGEDNPNSVVILSSGTLAKGPQAQALTQSGGGTLALGATERDNINCVNGVFVIGNNALNGMVRHDPSTDVYTIITGAPFRYFTSLYSRAIGAWSTDPRAVGWSVAGDEEDWAGAGSGTTILAETPDEITGARTIQNTAIFLRSMGLTLGLATGDSTLPIRFETIVRNGRQGCPYPSTIADDGNQLFWWGHDNAYRMDINWIPTPIGNEVRREVLQWLARGVLFRGCTVRMDYGVPGGGQTLAGGNQELSNPAPRLRYHLIPFQGPSGVPHYSFDVDSRTWSRHTYKYGLLGGCENFNLATSSTISAVSWNLTLFLDEATQDVVRWGDGGSGAGEIEDTGAFIKSPVFVVGDPTHEYKCQRLHIVWARDGMHGTGDPNPPEIVVKVACEQQNRPIAKEALLDAYAVKEGLHGWHGNWIDINGPAGQFFEISVDIPSTFRMQIAQVEMFLSDAGESKAGHFKQAV